MTRIETHRKAIQIGASKQLSCLHETHRSRGSLEYASVVNNALKSPETISLSARRNLMDRHLRSTNPAYTIWESLRESIGGERGATISEICQSIGAGNFRELTEQLREHSYDTLVQIMPEEVITSLYNI